MRKVKSKKRGKGSRTPLEKAPRMPGPRLFDWSNFDPSIHVRDGSSRLVEKLVTCRDRLPELLKNKGKYDLIKDSEVVGIYDRREDAQRESIERFRDAPALVMKIVKKEPFCYLGGAAF
jgi:hypothetical protein